MLPQLPLHGPVAVALQEVPPARHLRPAATDVHGPPVVRRRPEPTYLDGRISSRHWKARQRRLADQLGGRWSLVDRAGVPGAEAAVEQFLQLEAAGWKRRAGTALASTPHAC